MQPLTPKKKKKLKRLIKAIEYVQDHYCDLHSHTPYLLIGDVQELIEILTGKKIPLETLEKYKK